MHLLWLLCLLTTVPSHFMLTSKQASEDPANGWQGPGNGARSSAVTTLRRRRQRESRGSLLHLNFRRVWVGAFAIMSAHAQKPETLPLRAPDGLHIPPPQSAAGVRPSWSPLIATRRSETSSALRSTRRSVTAGSAAPAPPPLLAPAACAP